MPLKSCLFLLVATTCLLLSSCRKKGDNENLNDKNETASSLIPNKAGSWWLYGSNECIVTRRVATGLDSFKEGRLFDYFETTDTNTLHMTPEYFGKNGDFYIMLVDLDGSQQAYLPFIVNKTNPSPGDQWENTGTLNYNGIEVVFKTEGEIITTGGTTMINGTTYHHVTVTENVLKAKPALTPAFFDCGTIRLTFADGVGLIRSDYDINILNAYTRHYNDSLLAYFIAP